MQFLQSVSLQANKGNRNSPERGELMNFFLRTLGIFIAVGVAVWLVPGIDIYNDGTAAWVSIAIVAVIIALLNMSIKPIMQLLGLPISILTLGLFYLVINTALLYIAAGISNTIFNAGFNIETFGSGFVASIVISIVSTLVNSITGANRTPPY